MAVIGIGVDVVDVSRARRMLQPGREGVLERLLTAAEHAYVTRMRHPARHLAVRVAAKEAVYKALQPLPGARAVGWRDIEVIRGVDGRPSITLHGRAVEVLAGRPGARILLSLSHSGRTAIGMAVVEEVTQERAGNS